MENTKILTIQRLNQAYIKLIKMVLNGTYSANTPYINSFYHDPSPDQAYSLLTKILNQDREKEPKKDIDYSQGSGRKTQLKRAMTTTVGQQKQNGFGKGSEDLNERNIELKLNSSQKSTKKIYEYCPTIKQNEMGIGELKLDRLKRITGKITQIFANNHKKILKYEEISKYPSPQMNELKFAKPVELPFKKY